MIQLLALVAIMLLSSACQRTYHTTIRVRADYDYSKVQVVVSDRYGQHIKRVHPGPFTLYGQTLTIPNRNTLIFCEKTEPGASLETAGMCAIVK